MSSPVQPRELPARPSLEQLRKQAKDLLRMFRDGNPAAAERMRAFAPRAIEPSLADAQFVLAHEYGFESWAKLAAHVESIIAANGLEHYNRLAKDYVDAWRGGEEGLKRLSDLHGRSISPDEVREHVKRGFGSGDLTMDEAQQHVARLYGFAGWEKLVASLAEPRGDARSAPFGMSTTPPFYKIDWTDRSIEPRGPLAEKDWDTIFAVMKEHRLTVLNASGQISDAALERLTKLDFVTSLNIGGSNRVSDTGLAT